MGGDRPGANQQAMSGTVSPAPSVRVADAQATAPPGMIRMGEARMTTIVDGRRMRPAAVVLAVLALAGWTGASCGPRAPAPAASAAPPASPAPAVTAGGACAPTAGPLAPGARADGLAGEFRLTLVATHGAQAGQSASGPLTLRPYGTRPAPAGAAAGVRYPLFGGTDVDLAAVGALALGEVRPVEAARPGVLVLEWTQAGVQQITLRLGADANQGGAQRFDGTYMALTVSTVSADGFAGTWESGAGQPVAGGHFCAERMR
jgi:hypothetical protein